MFGVLNRSADRCLTPWFAALGHIYVSWKLKRNEHLKVRIFQGNNTKENTIRKKIRSKETHQSWRPCHSLTKRVFNTGAFQETQTTNHDKTKYSNGFISILREVLVSAMAHRYYWGWGGEGVKGWTILVMSRSGIVLSAPLSTTLIEIFLCLRYKSIYAAGVSQVPLVWRLSEHCLGSRHDFSGVVIFKHGFQQTWAGFDKRA